MQAAKSKSKQRTTRNRDDADVRFELVIMNVPARPFYPKLQKTVNTFFAVILKAPARAAEL